MLILSLPVQHDIKLYSTIVPRYLSETKLDYLYKVHQYMSEMTLHYINAGHLLYVQNDIKLKITG